MLRRLMDALTGNKPLYNLHIQPEVPHEAVREKWGGEWHVMSSGALRRGYAEGVPIKEAECSIPTHPGTIPSHFHFKDSQIPLKILEDWHGYRVSGSTV